ncbi:chorionic somatomammotropin hormone-like [Oryx dammah]|uniref:chorionic somatomammotropin hormone-like n=1 Tax=Oryx dammah TaxID=59534 RepID=UPI001A9ACD60|nr:chorionic somatomammotropin hormone-like [Oryx dammah]
MAFANLRLIHHLRVVHVLIYAGSHLLLLLVVSNLILCQGQENKPPYCRNQPGPCRIPLQSLFDRATVVANYNSRIAREMFEKFDQQYGQGISSTSKMVSNCHTASLATPDNKAKALNTEDKVLFSLLINLLHSWDEPLHHATTELPNLKGASPAILAGAEEIKEKTKVLLEGVEVIQARVHPGEEEKKNAAYPVWSEQSSLKAQDESVRQTAFYRMFYCLQRDSNKISTYLQILKCRLASCQV